MDSIRKEYLGYYRQMLQIRNFEEKVLELLMQNIIDGGSHLYAGEEAVAVGACATLRKDDYIVSTHRGHGHCIARGTSIKEMMAELLGKRTGCCKGKGGSLHIADFSLGNLGANGIVGGGIPIATGAGISIVMRKTDQVVLCFFGDGAVNQGSFHESLNMAAIWKLPVIYICENNLYGMSAAVNRVFPIEDLVIRAQAYNMPGEIADGMDVLAVRQAVQRAVDRARRGEGPSFVECKTYRYHGHSRSDPRVYRTKEEEELWHKRDPIITFKERLLGEGIATADDLSEVEKDVVREIEEAVQFALDSPWPDPSELYEDLFS
ncbi:MAG TPA: pyruvate dehydrogenase (acetyl-transferring) E1 component subunit alpha [Firmicutes bacterium]|nr:pyruvate dehydrogenase (acetyl-transferring) E1 component subunit alpha [Bacillota bacterium]